MDKNPAEDRAAETGAAVDSEADALRLAADEAEAEAAEAEAMAAAARAKAKAIRLRREAEEQAETAASDAVEESVAVEAPVTAASSGGPGWPLVVAATLIVVLSFGLVGAGGWMWWQHNKAVAEQHHRAEFAAAAAQGIVNMMSLDYRHAQQDLQRLIDGTTGDFKKEFEATAADFVKVAESSKTVTEATVTATAVQAVTGDTANVLVAATTKVSNAAAKDQQPRAWRWSVDVARDGDQIKLAKVEIVP